MEISISWMAKMMKTENKYRASGNQTKDETKD